MKNFTYLILFSVCTSFCFLSCNKDCVNPINGFELNLDYHNVNGSSPVIDFAATSSPEIQIDFNQTVGGSITGTNLVEVLIDNVRIIDDKGNNYEINDIRTYEKEEPNSDCDWREDSEFFMTFEPVKDLDVVMVLDASLSLGENFEDVKEYANEFVDEIFNSEQSSASSVDIGVISFSDSTDSFGLNSDSDQVKSYINGISQGRFTTLYEAIDSGIDMLNNASAEARAILVFTDGNDNNSDPSIDVPSLVQKAQSITGVPVSIFTIGFKGDVDSNILESLTINNGISRFPSSNRDLKKVFRSFSKAIANVYKLRYERNRQEIPVSDPKEIKIVFDAKKK